MANLCIVIETSRWIIAGTLILTFISAYLVYLNNRRNRRAEAGRHLAESFDGAIHHINNYDGQFYILENTLLHEFDRQRKAIREFKRHLDPINSKRFISACHQYYGDDDNSPYFRNYIRHGNPDNIKQALLDRINAITAFASKS